MSGRVRGGGVSVRGEWRGVGRVGGVSRVVRGEQEGEE